jgi:dTDP-4-dehydrorhamnose reductase
VKFIIIGASGFLGGYTMAYAKSKGYEVIGTQSSERKNGMVQFNLLEDRIENKIKPSFFKGKEPVYGVICAAIRQIDECAKDKDVSYKVNVEKTIKLIGDLQKMGVKPVYISSSFVFDGKRGQYVETDKRNPICEYGRQKALVEDFIAKEVPNAFVIRPDKIIGSNPEEEHLLSEWSKLVKEGKGIACMKGQVFSPTLVDDIAKAIVLGCEKNLSGIYHVASPETCTREELAKQFIKALGKEGKIEIFSKPLGYFKFTDPRPLKTYLNCSKFISATGMGFTTTREVFNRFINQEKFSK